MSIEKIIAQLSRYLNLPPRLYFLIGFLFCVGLILTALVFQYYGGLDPCPLCISQRIMVITTGLLMLVAAIHGPQTRWAIRIYASLSMLSALGGGALSLRHIYIQHLSAEKLPACGPGLDYMFEHYPFLETLRFMLSGTGDCAKVDWTLLGLSMPYWVLFCFLGLAALALWQGWNPRGRG